MRLVRATLKRSSPAAALTLALALSGCSLVPTGKDLQDPAVLTDAPVDGASLLTMLNAYRAEHGQAPLRLDPALNQVSRDMARHIAARDSMDTWQHSAFGLSQRLEKSGYVNYVAAENLGAGYADLPAAFSGWQGSSGHNKNLINPYVTAGGIARTNRTTGKWRNFWVLTLARPQEDGRPQPVR